MQFECLMSRKYVIIFANMYNDTQFIINKPWSTRF